MAAEAVSGRVLSKVIWMELCGRREGGREEEEKKHIVIVRSSSFNR